MSEPPKDPPGPSDIIKALREGKVLHEPSAPRRSTRPEDLVIALGGGTITAFPARSGGDGDRGDGNDPDDLEGAVDRGDGNDPDDLEGAVDRLNRNHAFILVGAQARIIIEDSSGPKEERLRFVTYDSFRKRHAALSVSQTKREQKEDGSWHTVTRKRELVPLWLRHPRRRTFDGIEFFPDRDNAPGMSGYYNLWRGFSCVPDGAPSAERWRKYKTFRDHLFTNVCSGNQDHFTWVFGWFAHMLQKPRARIGTALVFRGNEGVGKSKIGEVFGSLLDANFKLVDQSRYLTGQFNFHLASLLLLQVDEGFWAGNKDAEGRLKGLITSNEQMVEQKGVDPVSVANYVHLILTSNENWVVPAAFASRRYCVFDVPDNVIRNYEYFAEIDAEMANGGREALLADLLDFNLAAPGAPNLREVPKTEALLQQKIETFSDFQDWWYQRLRNGSPLYRHTEWETPRDGRFVPTDDLHGDYLKFCERLGRGRRISPNIFVKRLIEMVPDAQPSRPWVDRNHPDGSVYRRRMCGYLLPSLAEARAAFEARIEQSIKWPEDGSGDETSEGNSKD